MHIYVYNVNKYRKTQCIVLREYHFKTPFSVGGSHTRGGIIIYEGDGVGVGG